MGRVAVVTDSTACIPPELATQHDLTVLPLHLAFGDQLYQDGMTDADEFYRTLKAARRPPTTAAPPPGVYAEAILNAGRQADAVLCITVSRQFSAMHDSATQGAALARNRAGQLDVRVLDSGAAAMAQGFVALEAARAAQDGATIDEVSARAEALMPRVQLLVTIDTLTYLARSGRVPRALVWAASPLQLKPIVAYKNGAYRPIAITRTRPRAVERLLRALEERTGAAGLHVCVHHTNALEEAADLATRIRDTMRPKELFISEFTQVMGVHTGPGLLGFAFYTDS